ncbi:MAG: glycosyltransferase family 4 protein [Deltaproteobacteria bacterium]|nr:glycosyltransferase family 4 protein [Deltaproteobacteria bacterium]
MSCKRIVILDTGKEWGGGTNSLIELLKRMDKSRYEFSAVFYNNYKMGKDSDIKTEMEKLGCKFILIEQTSQKVYLKILKEVTRIALFFSEGLKKRAIFYLDYLFRILPDSDKIAALIRDGGCDLLYMNNQPSSNLEGILAAKALNLKCIQHSRIDVSLNSFEADAVNNGVSKVICVSKGVMDSLVRSGVSPQKCVVVYNGIDSAMKPIASVLEIRRMYGINDDEILIGTAGSLIKRKRINDLIESLVELREKSDKPFKCMVVGDGPEQENLQKEVLQRGLKEKVIFTGFQSDAISHINAMDIFALPSEKEGLPRVILEAMLMAKPVVACNVTGSSELVIDGETGFLVSVKGADMLANALLKLEASDDLRRRMGEKGRMRVIERFTIGKYVNGVSNIFEEVLA